MRQAQKQFLTTRDTIPSPLLSYSHGWSKARNSDDRLSPIPLNVRALSSMAGQNIVGFPVYQQSA